MLVEQRQVTHVNLADGKHRDIYMTKDGRGYKLSLMTKDEVVHLYLSHHDFHCLRQQVLNSEKVEVVKEYVYTPKELGGGEEYVPANHEPYVVRWSTMDWLAYN
jgi:hypothetical protein